MTTILRKVDITEREPINSSTWYDCVNDAGYMGKGYFDSDRKWDSSAGITHWLEEIEFPFEEMEQKFHKIMSETYSAGSYDKFETIDGIMKCIRDFVLAGKAVAP